MMELTFDGGTSQQRQWFQEAVNHARFPWDDLEVSVTVSWPLEPSLPGHKEFACTTTSDGVNFELEIRRSLDSSTQPDWSGRTFYEETVVHELAHVITFARSTLAEREALCAAFFKRVSGEGDTHGTAAELDDPDDAWEDRIQEAMAEVIKDTIMPESYRDYDNRTNWQLDPTSWDTFWAGLLAQTPAGVPDSDPIWSAGANMNGPFDPYPDEEYVQATATTGIGDLGGRSIRLMWANMTGDFEFTITHDEGEGVFTTIQHDTWSDSGDGTGYRDVTLPTGPDLYYLYFFHGEAVPFEGGFPFMRIYLTPPLSPADVEVPYHDPFVVAGSGDSMVFRTL